MEQTINFKCTGENLEQIPEDVAISKGLSFPKAHSNKQDMSLLSDEIRKHKKDTLCRLPFCVTVEAEAMGARINLGNDRIGPIVESYLCNTLEELNSLKEINLDNGRIREVLGSVEILSRQRKNVALSVEGPFTIASSLIDPTVLFKGIRKNKGVIQEFMSIIEDSIVKYILKGIESGAKIISYADPVGSMDIVGPKVYKEISGPVSLNILKRVEKHLDGTIVHVCGKTSTALEKLGLVEASPVTVEAHINYGEALSTLLSNNNIKFLGHMCIKRSPFKMAKPVVWSIRLNE